jgi:hypothetical protein
MYTVSGNPPASNAGAHAAGLEGAMERDRRFFKRHPFLSEYTREIMPGEYPAWAMPPSCDPFGTVTVRQIVPGVRVRSFHVEHFIVNVERGHE